MYNNKKNHSKNNHRGGLNGFWVFIILLVLFSLLYLFMPTLNNGTSIPLSTLIHDIKSNEVKSVVIYPNYATAVLNKGSKIYANLGTPTK